MSKLTYKQVLLWLQPQITSQSLLITQEDVRGDLCNNSQQIAKNDIFIAITGANNNGHEYLKKAVQAGAFLLIGQKGEFYPQDLPPEVSWIEVEDSAAAWAYLEDARRGFPSKELTFLGVGGSNGKTSSAWITHALLLQNKIKSSYLGTLGIAQGSLELTRHDYTTLPPDKLFSLLAKALQEKVTVVVIEVSSHALAQRRLGHIKFAGLAFTSFSQDHLDFHHSMKNYWNAKMLLFKKHRAPQGKIFVQERLKNKFSSYKSLQQYTHYYPSWNALSHDSLSNLNEVSFSYDKQTTTGKIPYHGNYNVENFFAALLLSSVILKKIPESWETLAQIPGRMELIAQNPHVVIDYAHTPDAIDKVMTEVKKLLNKPAKLWIVFGAGGDRDKSKRPLMTKAALKYADHVVLTSDNPRNEDPEQIIADLLRGNSQNKKIKKITSRKEAITYSLENAQKQDWIILAGKGHEKYQQIGLYKKKFCEHTIVSKQLEDQGH
jgi:UDP-N-acetylmuramoyl-L-alanyl-D-glutamate--2,6-diaminopimelate ligase